MSRTPSSAFFSGEERRVPSIALAAATSISSVESADGAGLPPGVQRKLQAMDVADAKLCAALFATAAFHRTSFSLLDPGFRILGSVWGVAALL
jgi:hypothetical protein